MPSLRSAVLPLAVSLVGCAAGGPPQSIARVAASASSASGAPSAAPSAAPVAAPDPAASLNQRLSAPPPPPPNPGSTKAVTKTDPAWATCHQGFEPKNKEVSKDVAAMAKACAQITKMTLVGKTLTGKQSDADPPQTFPFSAEASHCYRVYAQATDGIKDLDLAIKDSTGAIAGEDSTDDSSPVVVEDGAVCFKEADGASVVVSVGMGKGAYALQIWKD